MRRIIPFTAILLLLVLCAGCSTRPATVAAQPREHATVTKRDGTTVSGAIVANSGSAITLEGPNGVAQTITMDQVKTIEYEDHSSPHGAEGTGED
jgi:hypothetical protein